MGLNNISTLAEVDSFCRRKIYFILQRQFRWIFPESKVFAEAQLFKSYIEFAGLGSEASYYKRTSKAKSLADS